MSTRVALPGRQAPVPHVEFLDARSAQVDEPGLRRLARDAVPPRPARYTTRSYRYPYSLIAWHESPVGIDIERIETCDLGFADLICTHAERIALKRVGDRDAYLTSLWSGKEALAKALGDALQYEPRRLESPELWVNGCAGPWRACKLDVAAAHVAWVCWREGAPAPGARGVVRPVGCSDAGVVLDSAENTSKGGITKR